MRLPKVYEAAAYEKDIYALWEKSGAFQAHPEKKAERFAISMPPPNATGSLHVGHALGITNQDIMGRFARMQGKDVLLLPGVDHAALATNALMEKILAEEGTTKHAIGRDEFIRRLQEFIENSRNTIKSQIKALGASCDWSRERYTLDDALNRCVNEMFVRMYNDGIIYRGHRIVNWDPKLETTIADDEIERVEEITKFYTFQYGPFQISTARPETKFGDKYVVMHPDDKRYANYKEGDTFTAEWINGPVRATVIKDKAVDPTFGTGVMTITPWHDQVDFEIAERHNLDKQQIIDFHGKLLPIAEEFAGLPIEEARERIVKKLDKMGLLVHIDDTYSHSLAVNARGKGIIEPQIKLQWFLDVNKKTVAWKGQKCSLKEIMRDVIENHDITIVPSRFDKVYYHWIDNLRDWCISRQIWWGHRIPAWYRMVDDKEEVYVNTQPPNDRSEGWHEWEQDPDTLDTWFSSALWTWSTLIDSRLASDYSIPLDKILKASIDYQAYHPTTVMETGWDILFFWVARMILATTYMVGEVPFKTVYLHGLVRAETGEKMSKSKPETMIDPLEVIPKYGTDALRLALIHGTSPGNDQRMSIAKIVAERNFCNKLWNIARYIEAVAGETVALTVQPNPQTPADHWIINKLNSVIKKSTHELEHYHFGEAYDQLYHFIWGDFADWYIEASKINLNTSVLMYGLATILQLAHPFAPFVTETIWQTLNADDTSFLITSPWPATIKSNLRESKEFERIQTIVSEVRYLTNILKVPQARLLFSREPFLVKNGALIKHLARLKEVTEVDTAVQGIQLTQVSLHCWLDIPPSRLKHYQAQLTEKKQQQRATINQLEARLKNNQYLKNAPEKIVAQSHEQLRQAQDQLRVIERESQRFVITKL